jgi:hypothetical protein
VLPLLLEQVYPVVREQREHRERAQMALVRLLAEGPDRFLLGGLRRVLEQEVREQRDRRLQAIVNRGFSLVSARVHVRPNVYMYDLAGRKGGSGGLPPTTHEQNSPLLP